MKVKIENYQAIKEATLEFIPGVNAIVGPTNNGKSSIIRAIKGAVNNQGGSGFINYDADETTVTIEYKNHLVKWNKSKKPGKSFYEVDNNVLSKIGQTQVKEVADIMNMPEIDVGNERFQINFWKQMDKPFLVDRTAYQLFDFISKSKEQELISTLQATTESNYKDINKEITSLNAKANLTTETISTLEDELKELDSKLDFNIDVYTKLYNAYKLITDKIDSLNEINTNLEVYTNVLTKQDKILSSLNDYITKLDKLNKEYTEAMTIAQALDKINENTNLQKTILSNSTNTEKMLATKLKQLDNLFKDIDKTSNAITVIKDLHKQLTNTNNALDNTNLQLQKYKTVLKQATDELSSYKVCPLCERPLNEEGEHLHE